MPNSMKIKKKTFSKFLQFLEFQRSISAIDIYIP